MIATLLKTAKICVLQFWQYKKPNNSQLVKEMWEMILMFIMFIFKMAIINRIITSLKGLVYLLLK